MVVSMETAAMMMTPGKAVGGTWRSAMLGLSSSSSWNCRHIDRQTEGGGTVTGTTGSSQMMMASQLASGWPVRPWLRWSPTEA